MDKNVLPQKFLLILSKKNHVRKSVLVVVSFEILTIIIYIIIVNVVLELILKRNKSLSSKLKNVSFFNPQIILFLQ